MQVLMNYIKSEVPVTAADREDCGTQIIWWAFIKSKK